ncbi:inositol monophosphatase family protein [Marivita geojedonensis]|uniref:Inositol-1-monophosphatase n=1 Tax=Marivita geojedonensis TaxID=1123756 RepID=A0A1X4NHX9_9RHOB|nr:inositol monophosphatase family protein [Marivita geojedonensis]OSQ47577.1 inositol monophosphatase [Marivita geojedonensis]PRY74566.1 myo-inositol-1(or 4)-monophosphatase [Marivita geojedonensis]
MSRTETAIAICQEAGEMAQSYFAQRDSLAVDKKGAQDWVSEADRNVEVLIRERLEAAFPDDGIVGEEHAPKQGTSGFVWVIDPIDGTTNFVNGLPAWTIVLAGVADSMTQVGVIHDPIHGETFVAQRGQGATLNGKAMSVAAHVPMASGTVSVGYSNRVAPENILPVVADIVGAGAMFHRNASGALSLAYVAAGRLLGYLEEHMNAWDCLAGQLLIAEAGGIVEDQNADDMIANGGRVVVGAPQVFEALLGMADRAWQNTRPS